MHRALLIGTLGISLVCANAASTKVPIKRVTHVDANTSIHQVVRTKLDKQGHEISVTNKYTVVATGLNVQAPDGSFAPASTVIEAQRNGGAVAQQARHKIFFKPDIADANGPIRFVSGGRTFVSRPLCISYWDSRTGKSVLISEFRSTAATLTPGDSKIVWKDCATDFKCNLVIDNKLSGMDQCLEILEEPPAPSAFGLNNDTTRLQLITEFFNPPAAKKDTINVNGISDDGIVGFGDLKMGPGKAFTIGDSKTTHVSKHWGKLDGRDCLVEEIPYNAIKRNLKTLPQHALNEPRPFKPKRVASLIRELPQIDKTSRSKTAKKVQLANLPYKDQGMVLDYSITSSSTNPVVFKADTTYLVDGYITLSSTVTFEGGTVVKYRPDSGIGAFPANVHCTGDTYRPVTFTAWNDDSIGEVIEDSDNAPSPSGSAFSFYYGNFNAQNANFRYFDTAISAIQAGDTFSNCQISHCNQFNNFIYGQVAMKNCLFYDVQTCFFCEGSGSTLSLENVTVHNSDMLVDVDGYEDFDWSSNPSTWPDWHFGATNSLFVGVSAFGTYTNGVLDHCGVPNSDTGVFETAGGGAHYLPTNSIYCSAGTTNIDSSLLSRLSQQTTHAPTLFTNAISNIVLSPIVARDTNSAPDLGYHYNVLDYLVGTHDISRGTAVLTNGVAVGFYRSIDSDLTFALLVSETLLSEGSPERLNTVTIYNTVQETPDPTWCYPANCDVFLTDEDGVGTSLNFRFTRFTAPAGIGAFVRHSDSGGGPFFARDCEFYGGGLKLYAINDTGGDKDLENCLFVSSSLYVAPGVTDPVDTLLIAHNNLFWSSSLSISGISPMWPAGISFTDNFFGTNTIFLTNIVFDVSHNAYLTNCAQLTNNDSTDIILPSFNFQTGPLGNFYQPTNSALIGQGSRPATNAGFYHYTVFTNQVVEGTNDPVTIGLHYVAVDANGNPLDTNGDGTPDYLQDSDGNGLADEGEDNWLVPVFTLQPATQTVCSNSAVVFQAVAAGPSMTYQWRTNGVNLANGSNITGCTTSNLTINSFSAANLASYSVVATRAGYATTSTVATASFYSPSTGPTNVMACIGTSATFAATPSGPGPFHYEWSKVGGALGTNVFGTNTATLTINPVQGADAGTYTVQLMGVCGTSVVNTNSHAQLRLTSGTNTITVFDGDANDQSSDEGVVYYNGPVGALWNVDVTIGITKPIFGNSAEPYMDLSSYNFSTSAADLTIQFTDTDFTANQGTFDAEVGGTSDGSVTFNYYVDGNNTPFGTNTLLASASGADAYSFSSNGTVNVSKPYSMTLEANIHHTGFGTTGFDQQLMITNAFPEVGTNDYKTAVLTVCTNLSVTLTNPVNNSLFSCSPTNILLIASVSNTYLVTNVEFFVNTTYVGVAEHVTSNAYSLNYKPAFGGTNTYSVRVHDAMGNTATDQVTAIVNFAPTISITNPASGAEFYSPGTNILISALAHDLDGDGTITNVQFFVGTNRLGAVANPPFNFTWTNVPAGTYSLVARATDNKGASANSTAVTITVFPTNTAPFVDAGPDQIVELSTNAMQLSGVVIDDNLPSNSLAVAWTKISGPGTVTFGDTNNPQTTAVFTTSGTNVLQLCATDGQFTNCDTVTIVVKDCYHAPSVFAGTNQTVVLPALKDTNLFDVVKFTSIGGDLSYPTGGDFFPPSNCVVLSISGGSHNFELVDPVTGVHDQFSSISNLPNEIYIATVKDTLGGFHIGGVFSANGAPGEIMKISPAGTNVGTLGVYSNAWIVLTNNSGVETDYIGGLYVDRTGLWGGDLIVTTISGNLYRIHANGNFSLITTLPSMLLSDTYKGILTVPTDPGKYGPWAGRLLVGHEETGAILAVDTNGLVARYDTGVVDLQDMRIIPANQNFFGIDTLSGSLWGIDASYFETMVGDILFATQGNDGGVFRIHWNGDKFERSEIGAASVIDGEAVFPASWEQMAFAPAGIANLPPVPQAHLQGNVSNRCDSTTTSWMQVSGPGSVEFADPSRTNTLANFSAPGEYLLRLQAQTGEFVAYSNVFVTVVRNQQPTVNAGTNQIISTTNTVLYGDARDDGLPAHQTNFAWVQIEPPLLSGAGNATFAHADQLSTAVTFDAPGRYLLRLFVDDGQATNYADVEISVQIERLELSPTYGWPSLTNTATEFHAVLKNASGPITNQSVTFHVAGVTPDNGGDSTVTTVTDTNGVASLIYSGIVPGRDSVYAEFYDGSTTIVSPTAFKDWSKQLICDLWITNYDSGFALEWPVSELHHAQFYSVDFTVGHTESFRWDPDLEPEFRLQNVSLRDPDRNIVASSTTGELTYTPAKSGEYLLETADVTRNQLTSTRILRACTNGLGSSNLNVLAYGTNVSSGGTVYFPTTSPAHPTNVILVITNTGDSDLMLGSVITSGDFSVSNDISNVTVPASSSTNLTVVFLATTNGSAAGSIAIQDGSTLGTYFVNLVGLAFPAGAPPTIEVSSPTTGTSLFAPGNISVSATVTKGLTNVAYVEFYVSQNTLKLDLGRTTSANPSALVQEFSLNWASVSKGDYTLHATAVDVEGRRSTTTTTVIHVLDGSDNRNPFARDDFPTVLANSTYNVFNPLENDSDPDHDALTITSIGKPFLGAAQIINSGHSISYIPTSGYAGSDYFRYTVSDGKGGSATATIYVKVWATDPPSISFVAPNPGTIVTSGVPVTLSTQVTPTDFQGKVEFFIRDIKLGEATNAPYNLSWTPVNHDCDCGIIAKATDIFGQYSSSLPLFLNFTNPAGVSTPIARIDNVTNSISVVSNHVYTNIAIIRDGLFDLYGKAFLTNPLSTNVSIAIHIVSDSDGSLVRDVTPFPRDADGFHPGAATTSSKLATLDLTTIENGVYDLELIVRGDYQDAIDTKRFALESQLKIGQFSFTEQDMVIPVNGYPITVMRTYNSLNPNTGDFGRSWTYSVNDVQLQIDEDRQQTASLFQDDAEGFTPSGGYFSLRTGGGRNVTLNLPDGRRTTFLYYLQGTDCSDGDEASFCAKPAWQSAPGIFYDLKPLKDVKLVTLTSGVEWWTDDASTSVDAYDFSGFVLTSPDGTQYIIKRDDLDEQFYLGGGVDGNYAHPYGQAHLTQIIQRTGDKINISPKNIVHVDPLGNTNRTIKIVRDDQNRIAAIYDPNGLDSSGHTSGPAAVIYQYAGENLMHVLHLQDRVHSLYTTNTYEYTNAAFPHYITGIVDGRGIQVAKNFYDDSGKLTAVEDANGKRTVFQHNTSNNVEVVTDRAGNTNSYVYDLRGNVIATTNALNQVALSTYNDINLVIAETNAFGTSFATWKTNAYDTAGNLTKTVDALHTNSFTYDSFNNLLTQTDSIGNVTSNLYDNAGNLTDTYQLDPQLNVVAHSSSVFIDGKLVETDDANSHATASFGYTGENLTSATDANGLTRNFGYDENGNQTNSTFTFVSGGLSIPVTTRSEFDGSGRVTRSIDADTNETRTIYNSLGKVEQSIDKLGNTNSFFYDSRGNLVETDYPDGLFTRSVYDDNGRAVFTMDRNGVTGTRTDYDALGRVTNSVRFINARIDLSRDSYTIGVWHSTVGAYGTPISTNSSEYYPNGLVKSRTDAAGQKTTYDYWADGQVRYVTNALTNVTYFEYDPAGHQSLIRDARLHETRFTYDAVGRMTKTTFDNSTYTSNVFNNVGQRVGQVDQANILKSFTYDLAGQLTAVTNASVPDPEAAYASATPTWQYHYDQYGRLTIMDDAKGRHTTNVFDAVGRSIGTWLPMGQTNWNEYNSKGQLYKQHDFKGQTTELVYDRFGRTRAKFYFAAGATSPSNAVCYTYNQLGQLAKITERSGADATTNACDGYLAFVGPSNLQPQNWAVAALVKVPSDIQGGALVIPLLGLTMLLIPSTTKRRFIFSIREALAGLQPVEETRRKFRAPSLALRTLSFVMIVVLLGTDDKFGVFSSAYAQCTIPANYSTETTRITEFSYDADGHLTQVNSPEGVINYGYDLATGRHTDTCTANSEIGYGYDQLGRLKTVTVYKRDGSILATPEQTTYTYDTVGNRESITLPNGIVSTWKYDNLNRLTNLTHQAGTTNLATYVYQLHSTGRRTNAFEVICLPGGTCRTNSLTWAYDQMYRLTNEVATSTVSSGQYTDSYEYDKVGNRLRKIHVVGSNTTNTTYAYNSNDELLQEVASFNSLSTTNLYSYDANGSLTNKTGTGAAAYTYDLKNKLSAVTISSVTTSYLYNDQGIRVRSSVGSSKTHFLTAANNPTGYAQTIEELSTPGGTPNRSYIIGDDMLGQATSSTASYFLPDGHGSTRQLAGNPSSVSSQYNYDGYGNSLVSLGNSPDTTHLYCREQFDTTLQMYNLRARYYDPVTSLFNERDSFEGRNLEPQSLHRYAYCGGDPVGNYDPTGNDFVLVGLLAVVAVASIMAVAGLAGGGRLARGPVATTTNPQVPAAADWAQISTLHHSAYIEGSSWTKQQFFQYMTSLEALPSDVIQADNRMTGTGQIVTFTLQGAKARLGQRPFKVKTVRYDTDNLICVVVTLDGHPLKGWRAWQVSEKNGKVLLDTWSVDEPANEREAFKFEDHWYLGEGGAVAQRRTWQGMLENIAATANGTIRWESDPLGERSIKGDYQQLWQRMGVSPNGD
jgi:RHS repeat-associated protein